MPPEHKARQPRLLRKRYLFDELLPWRVASALRALEYKTSYVDNEEDNTPERGSPDQIIIEHARRHNQVLVTSNHDMIVLLTEQKQSFIWLDPRGRQFTREEMVVRIFLAAHEWEEIFREASEPVCIHTMRTKNEVLTLDRAAHLVKQRMRRLAARRRREPKPKPLGSLIKTTSE